ncbi:hypothetical protein ACFCXS_22605 [Streptomyces sp. NPDC056373]
MPAPAALPEDCDESPSWVSELAALPEDCDESPSWVSELAALPEESGVGR